MSASAEPVAASAPAPESAPAAPASSSEVAAAKKVAKTKKPANPKSKASGKSKTTTSKSAKAVAPSGRPSWKDIIKECIIANKGDARQGVSRATIKKFAEEQYKLEVTGVNLSQLNRAIASGAEHGLFVLPKGPSGKVKLAPKGKTTTSGAKENAKPLSRNKAPSTSGAKKPAVKSAEKKTTAAPKKAKAKAAGPTKKTTAPSKRGGAKKAVTGTTTAARATGKKAS